MEQEGENTPAVASGSSAASPVVPVARRGASVSGPCTASTLTGSSSSCKLLDGTRFRKERSAALIIFHCLYIQCVFFFLFYTFSLYLTITQKDLNSIAKQKYL